MRGPFCRLTRSLSSEQNEDHLAYETTAAVINEGDPDLDTPKVGDKEAFLRQALARFKLTEEAEGPNRTEALIDDAFRNLEQWDQKTKTDRDTAGRPALTIDKLNHPIRQVLNAQRQARPGIKVNPKTAGSAQETATILQGLIRQIEYDSQADVAYDWAFEQAATSGLGYFRILTEFAAGATDGPAAWDQEIKVVRILNKYSVYFDPSAAAPDKSDARWCFITEDIPIEEYKLLFPKSDVASLNDFSGLGNAPQGWLSDKAVRVAEYWYTEPKQQRILLLKDGQTALVDTLNETTMTGQLHNGVPILNYRDIDTRVVKFAKINATQILEGNTDKTGGQDWPGTYIPVVPVVGEELFIDSKRVYRGMIRAARDSQRMYNYQASELVRQLSIWGRVPWVGAIGQFKGLEAKWGAANIEDFPFLEYNPVSVEGHLAPPPQRNGMEPPIQSIVIGIQQASEDIKSTTGFFDPSLGKVNNTDRSGRAILALQQAGELGSSNFQDNLRRALIFAGKIIVDLIPHIYDRPGRLVTVLGKDDKPSTVMFNQPFVPGAADRPPQPVQPGMPPPQGAEVKVYDLKNSKFSVTVSVGRSHATKRMERDEGISTIIEKVPSLAPVLAGPWLRSQDWDGAEEMAERVDKMLPPELQPTPEGQPKVPPQVQAQMQQLMQQHEILTKLLQEKDEIIRTKQLELASKEQQTALVELTKLSVADLKAEIERMKIAASAAQAAAQAAVQEQEGAAERAHASQEGAASRAHASQEGQAQRQHATAMTETEQQEARLATFQQQAHERAMLAEQQANQPSPQGDGDAG